MEDRAAETIGCWIRQAGLVQMPQALAVNDAALIGSSLRLFDSPGKDAAGTPNT
jgi:hypothetical protein